MNLSERVQLFCLIDLRKLGQIGSGSVADLNSGLGGTFDQSGMAARLLEDRRQEPA
jgi:hypothetical protein